MTNSNLIRLAHGGLSPVSVTGLVTKYGSVDGAVAAIERSRANVNDVVRAAVSVSASQRIADLSDAGISFVVRGSEGYPPHLDRFDDSPLWLFSLGSGGTLGTASPAIGIVGSRSCTTYGLELAEAYGRMASNVGWTVVSGLARGIDAAAHRGAVEGTSPCVGVLGCGVDVVYPAENRHLYRRVLDTGGAIISEYPPGTTPHAWRFPTRNRIIAAMSDVVLVVEATHKGGALITARVALDYGVPVYAVPGDVDRKTSEGTNALIRDGAFPIFDPDDLRQVLELVTPLVLK
jgi:DNA processing protein